MNRLHVIILSLTLFLAPTLRPTRVLSATALDSSSKTTPHSNPNSNSESISESKNDSKGQLPELKLNRKTESENLKIAAEAETLISKSEEKAISQLEVLLAKYKGTTQEPDLLFRLAELYARRAKTGRFVDLYRGEKNLSEILSPKLTAKGAKAYLSQAISNYQKIQQKFPQYPAMDEVLFNRAFAHEQRGETDEAVPLFLLIPEKYKNSELLPETHMALGELYFQKKNYSESQKHYERVQQWGHLPIAPIALYKSAWCSYNLKKTEEGMLKLETVLLQSQALPHGSHVRSEARRDLALFFSDVGDPLNSTRYFSKHLLENEVGLTVLDLSAVYERHGKLNEMDLVLALFLKEYPTAVSAGAIHLRRIQHLNEKKNVSGVAESVQAASKLCLRDSWKNQSPETLEFCATLYPKQLQELVAERWELWNLKRTDPPTTKDLAFMFQEYLFFESKTAWNIPIHMSFAEFQFSQGEFANSVVHYEGVSHIEKLDPKILHEALHGVIVSLDRSLQLKPTEKEIRKQLYLALNRYLTLCPQGLYLDEVNFKKAFLFYEDKDYTQSLAGLRSLVPKSDALKIKQEDLIMEIHRTQKDFESLATASFAILKASKGERAQAVLKIYQEAQWSLIQSLLENKQWELAALKAKAFYEEHRPEAKALEALHLAIELWDQTKHLRLAGEASETLAKEMTLLENKSEAQRLSQWAVQAFLRLGDLKRTQLSLQRAIPWTEDSAIKKESLELLAEISGWYQNIEATESAWSQLEPLLRDSERAALWQKRLIFFEKNDPKRAEALKKALIQKGIEPYVSESLLTQTHQLCDQKKWSQCYQMAVKLNRDSNSVTVRDQARYLQGEVLKAEYFSQSLKASMDRLALVMSIKAEKFDKATQVLNTISQKSETVEMRLGAAQDLIALYKNYVSQLKESLSQIPADREDLIALKHEIEQILPVLTQRPLEYQQALVELQKIQQDSPAAIKGTKSITPFPELVGTELRIYLPTWEESVPFRPWTEIKVSAQSCNPNTLSQLQTLSSLGKEANSCWIKKEVQPLEEIALRLSDLFPESAWGPFYLSISATLQGAHERALWYLKLGQKRQNDPMLIYEELRQSYAKTPDALGIKELQKFGAPWRDLEEVSFLRILQALKEKKCPEVAASWDTLRARHWKTNRIESLILKECPKGPQRSLSSRAENP